MGATEASAETSKTDARSRPESDGWKRKARALFAWMIVPELLVLLAASALVNLSLKRLVLTGVATFFLLLLPLSRVVPPGVLPLRGKWLRRMLAGLAVLGIAYAGPVAAIRKITTYNWTISQMQQGIQRYGTYRPNTRLPLWLGEVDIPRWIGGLPISAIVAAGGVLLLLQFKLLWDVLDDTPARTDDDQEP